MADQRDSRLSRDPLPEPTDFIEAVQPFADGQYGTIGYLTFIPALMIVAPMIICLIALRAIRSVFQSAWAWTTSTESLPTPMGFPRFWELFAVILPRSVRERIYEPYVEELKEDYLLARKRWRTPWAKRWVTLAFTLRTAWAVVHSLWVAGVGAACKWAAGIIVGLVGVGAVGWVRRWLAELWGRLP